MYDWHVNTSADKFEYNVSFLDDKAECISLVIADCEMRFKAISDTGLITEDIKHVIGGSRRVEFNALFYKNFLKIVTAAVALHKTLIISFNEGDEPIRFMYELDQETPQSYFSVYMVPIVESN